MQFLNAFPNDPRQPEFATLFGDLDKLPGSEHDPAVWLQQCRCNPAALPRLFIACGRQDDLYPLNVMFNAACQELGVPVEYHEEDGNHDWFFWDRQIQRFLAAVLGPSQI